MDKKQRIIKSIEFWIEYHKKGYSKHDKLPVEHILIILEKIKKGSE